MRKWIVALILIPFLLASADARAQQVVQLSNLKVALWPEYDHPSMLVIYTFELSADTALPANITLRIPATAGDPHAVAVGPSLLQVGDVPFNRQMAGEWSEISFIATMPAIQFEYYDPSLAKDGEKRFFEYHWPGEYAVDSLVIEVQQPLGAREVRLSPSLGNGARREDGLVYNVARVGSLNAGQTFKISMEYLKDTETLSAEQILVQPSQPLTPDTTGRTNPLQEIFWPLVVLGVALIVGGGLWYWQSGKQEDAPRPKRRRPPAAEARVESDEAEAGVYCHQCGKRAGPGDRFCRSCGARLPAEDH